MGGAVPGPGWVAPRPRILWIELTSKCPYDCVFCSRKLERNTGQHMSFDLYQAIIGQLSRPDIIRLNYSGESLHYPHLAEAIQLARSTGATTEIVTALSSASDATLRALVDARLDRLSVSIHALTPSQYQNLYQFSSVTALQDCLAFLIDYKRSSGQPFPDVDFAFVAMRENLEQLRPLAGYARSLGVHAISVHPVIRRNPAMPQWFSQPCDDLPAQVEALTRDVPGVSIQIARPAVARDRPTTGLTTCEQNPWETLHILADGTVVACEVQDKTPLGDLTRETLAGVWHGPSYTAFRERYLAGRNLACQTCPWRNTVASKPRRNDVKPLAAAMIRGWHPLEPNDVRWSQASAALAVTLGPGDSGISLSGVLPPAPGAAARNEIVLRNRAGQTARFSHDGSEPARFTLELPLPGRGLRDEVVSIETSGAYCPATEGTGPDLRHLGFALEDLSALNNPQRATAVDRLFGLLHSIDGLRTSPSPLHHSRIPLRRFAETGLTLLIPERGNHGLLQSCLDAAATAVHRVDEPTRILVAASDADPLDYESTRRAFPSVHWLFSHRPLTFQAAVRRGLAHTATPWVYLLNSDMQLDPNALVEVLRLRRPNLFAAGSRIRMQDGSHTETNWTGLRTHPHDAAELVERDPAGLDAARGSLYAGGGSSLFFAPLLKRLIRRTRCYEPFYWEDAEWGATAWRHGCQTAFAPASAATHGRRQTIARYYPVAEIDRIFERNRLLFHLRNLRETQCLRDRLIALDEITWNEIFRLPALASLLRARARAARSPEDESALHDRWTLTFEPPVRNSAVHAR